MTPTIGFSHKGSMVSKVQTNGRVKFELKIGYGVQVAVNQRNIA